MYKFSTLISIHQLGEFVKRSKHFPLGNYFINSYHLFSWLFIAIVKRKLTSVTIKEVGTVTTVVSPKACTYSGKCSIREMIS